MTDAIHYSSLIDAAMRGVVRDVLRQVEKSGLPGEHHFYITFRTDAPGAQISDTLKSRYPQEMTIVLQHQFWDFHVGEQEFNVTLSFGGVPEKLVVPYAALTAFADPSIRFGLQFQNAADQAGGPPPSTPPSGGSSEDDGGTAEIISLDAFRKK